MIILHVKIFLQGCQWWALPVFLLDRTSGIFSNLETSVAVSEPWSCLGCSCQSKGQPAQAWTSPSRAETQCFWVRPKSSTSSPGWSLCLRQALGGWGCWSHNSKCLPTHYLSLQDVAKSRSRQQDSMDLIESKWWAPRLFLLPALGSSRCPGLLPSPCRTRAAAGRGSDLFLRS